MCEHNGLAHIECEPCANSHAVCAHNIFLSMQCAACFNAGVDWQYSTSLGDQLLSYLDVYPQQQHPPPQPTARDLVGISFIPLQLSNGHAPIKNAFNQAPTYDLEAVRLQTVDPSQITSAPPKSSLVDSLYPPGVASYMQYRSRLIKLLDSPCIRDQTSEDSQYTKDFFIKGQGDSGVLYRCSVKDCKDSFTRLDRATNHFRTHIEHRPFECEGCDKGDCHDRFYSKETRKAHMVKKLATCECGSQLEAKNLKRHQEQAKGCTATHTAE